jgi:hypothetical protein
VAFVPRIDTNSVPADVGAVGSPSTTVVATPGKPPKYSPNNLSVQIPSPSALSSASQSSQFLSSSSSAGSGTGVSTTSGAVAPSSSAGSGGGGHTPGKSPKVNPFSSASPKTNPFMTIDSTGKASHGFWGGAETTAAAAAAAGAHSKNDDTINKGGADDGQKAESHGEAGRRLQKEVVSAPIPAPVSVPAPAPALPVAPPLAPTPAAAVVNPFLKATSGISLNIPGNPFGIGVGGLTFPSVGGAGSSFLSSVAAAASGKSVFGPSEGGGILKALSSGAAPVAVFGSSSSSSSGSSSGAGAESGIALRGSSAPIPSILSSASSSKAQAFSHIASVPSTGSEGDKDGGGDGDIPGVGDDYNPEEESTAAFVPVYTFAPGMAAAAQITGEEDEDCLLQVRAKLFRLVQVKHKAVAVEGAGDGDEQSPPVASENDSTAGASAAAASSSEWVEVGVGPLRILREKSSGDSSGAAAATGDAAVRRSTRIVMRREDKKGGAGTKVILNLRLLAHCVLAKNGDKAFSISTLLPKVVEVKTSANAAGAEPALITTTKTTDEVEMVSYLLRCKAPTETHTVMSLMRSAIDACK